MAKPVSFYIAVVGVPLFLAAFGFVSAILWPMDRNPDWPEQRPEEVPPGVVFRLVWPILYFVLGVVLVYTVSEASGAANKGLLLGTGIPLAALLLSWAPVFAASTDGAVMLTLAAQFMALAFMALGLAMGFRSSAAMSAMVVWLGYASDLGRRTLAKSREARAAADQQAAAS